MKRCYSMFGALCMTVAFSVGYAEEAPVIDESHRFVEADETFQESPESSLTQATESNEVTSSQLALLLNKLEALKSSQQALQGQVEMLTHELAQLKNKQATEPFEGKAQKAEVAAKSESIKTKASITSWPQKVVVQIPSDDTLFHRANEALKGKRLDLAKNDFLALIESYPDSPHRMEASFWLGELSLKSGDAKGASTYFELVANDAGNKKAPLALYKLGLCQIRLGEKAKARALLNLVQSQYPSSTVALLAEQELQALRS